MRRLHLPAVVAVVVVALLVLAGGVAVFLSSPPVSFGWFAYAPLDGASFSPGGGAVLLSGQEVWGVLLVALALVGLVGVGGYVLGRRRGTRT